ncbi:MAG: TlpA family protein disulfide reductase [Gammaproteobacteria bacterium]|nr:TlpA family protein disulfide reductase [Gammaproteobacteria bacterium]
MNRLHKGFTGLLIILMLSGCEGQTPDFYDAAGEGYTYAQLREKWLIVNYWATWCAPCIKEIPEFNQLARDRADIQIFGVNFDGAREQMLDNQIQKMGISFPVFAEDPAKKLGLRRPDVLPTTFLIPPGENMRVIMLVGPQDRNTLLAEIEQSDQADS